MGDHRSVDLRFLWTREKDFRSALEQFCYYLGFYVVIGIAVIWLAVSQPWSSIVTGAASLGVMLAGVTAWYSWKRWGRKAFPLPPERALDP